MLTITLTLALTGFAVAMLARLVRHDGRKIMAALQGRSWAAEPPYATRPVTVRFSPRYPVSQPVCVHPALRVAA